MIPDTPLIKDPPSAGEPLRHFLPWFYRGANTINPDLGYTVMRASSNGLYRASEGIMHKGRITMDSGLDGDKCCIEASGCAMRWARRALDELSKRTRIELVIRDMREAGYKSHSWQMLKRIMSEPIARCLKDTGPVCGLNCIETIYVADLTGGEYSYAGYHGGKDMDIIVYNPCETPLDARVLEDRIESCLENAIGIVLNEFLGVEPKKILGIPNIVEIHVVRDKRDFPYYNMIKSRSSAITRLI